MADATDEHPAFVHGWSFVEETVPAPSTSPGVCPSLEEWKYQYGYDPSAAVKHQHIAYEHIGIASLPAPCCGTQDTARRRMRQATTREGLFAIDVELALGNAPASSDHFGSGVKTVYGAMTPFPRVVTEAVYRAKSHLPTCVHYAAPATTPTPPADAPAAAPKRQSRSEYFGALNPLVLVQLPPHIAIKAPTNPTGSLGNQMVSRSFVRAVREDTLRGSEGHATFAAIEKCKLEEAFGEAARGYASATSSWLARLDGVVGGPSTIVDGFKVDMHRLLCLWLQHRMEKQTHPALSRPTALGSPSADLIGSVIDTEARIQVPFLRRELQAAASLTQSVGQAVTFDHCEPIARATQLTGEVSASASMLLTAEPGAISAASWCRARRPSTSPSSCPSSASTPTTAKSALTTLG